MEEQDDAIEQIRHYVWSGFYQPDEVAEIVCGELFEPGVLDEDWVGERIAAEFAQKRTEEASWETPTDCDRLDLAFAQLRQRRIITLQNAGYTQSEGINDISEEWHSAGGKDSDIEGYCFYHGQDLERAVRGEGLMLTFGDILGGDDKGVVVGDIVREVMEANGFRVEWDGTIGQRFGVSGMRWQKRSVS